MAIFSPQPLKKWIFYFFRQSDPPGWVKMLKCAIFAMDSERWWCLLSKNHSILNLRVFFHIEKYVFLHNMLPSPYCVTRPQLVKGIRGAKKCTTLSVFTHKLSSPYFLPKQIVSDRIFYDYMCFDYMYFPLDTQLCQRYIKYVRRCI